MLEALARLSASRNPDPRELVDSPGLGLVHADPDDLWRAALLNKDPARRKAESSLVECLGHAIARRMNVLFLNGDARFQDMPGVDFVEGP